MPTCPSKRNRKLPNIFVKWIQLENVVFYCCFYTLSSKDVIDFRVLLLSDEVFKGINDWVVPSKFLFAWQGRNSFRFFDWQSKLPVHFLNAWRFLGMTGNIFRFSSFDLCEGNRLNVKPSTLEYAVEGFDNLWHLWRFYKPLCYRREKVSNCSKIWF